MLIVHNRALLMLRLLIMVDMMDKVDTLVGLGWVLEQKSKYNSSVPSPSQDSMLTAHNKALLMLRLFIMMERMVGLASSLPKRRIHTYHVSLLQRA